MEGFAFGLSDIVLTDANRATFTLHLSSPSGETVVLRDCRLLGVGSSGAHVVTPLHYIDGERVRLVTLPKRLRRAIAAAMTDKLIELGLQDAV